MISLVLGIVLSVLVVLITTAIERNNRSGLKNIPTAHFTSPFSNLWLLGVRWRSVENRTRADIHRRLGPVVRIGPNEVSVDGVEEGVHVIYASKFYKDDWWRRAFSNSDDDILFTFKSTEEHKRRRKMLAGIYSKSNVLGSTLLDETLTRVIDCLRDHINSWAKSGEPIEFKHWMKASIMDIMTSWGYGSELGTHLLRDEAARSDLSRTISESWAPLFWRCDVPRLTAILRLLGINVIPRTSFVASDKLIQWFNELTSRASSRRTFKSTNTANIYEHLYENISSAEPEVPDKDINTLITPELYDHIIAGYELCGIALTYTVYELSRSPNIQHALRQELRTLEKPSNQLRAHRIDNLPLLDDILMETLRARPPGIGPWPRIVPEGGCRVADCFNIPAGTKVSTSTWTIHGNAAVFPAPWEWRPERWSQADPEQKVRMKKWFWAFGSGARMCIAMHFAVRILKEILVGIYTDYETSLDENFTGNMEQIDALLGLPISNNLDVKFRRSPPSN